MNLKLKRTPGIYLIGFMGSGKSTVGRLLAEEIGWRFADIDDDIEHQQRRSIPALFETLGEEAFRQIEHDAILRRVNAVRRGVPIVLALGGGSFTRPENIELLCENGITVWLDTTFSIVQKRVGYSDHRPLARDPKRFAQLYEERREMYAKADFRVEIKEDNSRLALAELLKLQLLD